MVTVAEIVKYLLPRQAPDSQDQQVLLGAVSVQGVDTQDGDIAPGANIARFASSASGYSAWNA